MEVTVNINVKNWYKNSSDNDLLYWGLDYPPLTAYHSYINGKIAQYINPLWVELNTSRGFESYYHKIFMRSTVLVVDLIIYFTAISYYWFISSNPVKPRDKAIVSVITLISPGLILIDYGHFQYNCVSLGLVIWSINFLIKDKHFLASIMFSLALNYKQMTLYYAFPIFWYLLSECFQRHNKRFSTSKFISISFAVVITFIVCWLPYIDAQQSLLQVLQRLFPISRGIYEDKVSNFWYSISIIIKLKKYFSDSTLAMISAITTFLALIPSNIQLFRNPTIMSLKYALINSSLIFFLLSFQVHEKSILMVTTSVLLVMDKHPLCCLWFVIISTFSLQPLVIKDGLMFPYFALIVFFVCVYFNANGDLQLFNTISWKEKVIVLSFFSSMMGCLLLNIISIIIPAPKTLPHIHSLLNCLYSFIHLMIFSIYFHELQFEVYKSPIANSRTPTISFPKNMKKQL